MPAEELTPYALEHYRAALLRRQLILLLLIIAGLILLWVTFFKVTTETTTELSLYGGENGSVTIRRPQDQGYPSARLTLEPGRTARLDEPLVKVEQPELQSAPTPAFPSFTAPGIPVLGILLLFSPLLVARWIWRSWKDRVTPLKEANFGVYKGPLPLEMHTRMHRDIVVTTRLVPQNPFGKRYADYLRDAFSR